MPKIPDQEIVFGRERIDDRQVAEVLGIIHGIIADGQVNQAEIEYLQKWLASRLHVTANPIVRTLHQRVHEVLADDLLEREEAEDLLATFKAFVGGDFEHGEITRSTTLPICDPAPAPMLFDGSAICFTGTFAFGRRKDCEAAAVKSGAIPGPLTMSTRYLVVGAYATESWSQSAFGRKIEKAVDMRARGKPINIVSEMHWAEQMKSAGRP